MHGSEIPVAKSSSMGLMAILAIAFSPSNVATGVITLM